MRNTSIFTQYLKSLLRPLVKLLLNEGFAYQDFDRLIRQVLVEVADEEFKLAEGKKQSTARIAIITGLNRKEVQKLRQPDEQANEESFNQNRAAAVISGWQRDPLYPKDVLAIEGDISFSSLVKKYSRDMPVRATLDELLRVGAIKKLDKQTLRLERDVYVPESSKLHKFGHIANASADLLKTGLHNLDHEDTHSHMQLTVSSDKLTRDTAAAFKKYSNKKNMELLKDLDAWLSSHETDDGENIEQIRAGVGIYYFEDIEKSGR